MDSGSIGKKAASKMSSIHKIAIFAEDNSDYDSIKTIIARLTGKDNLSFQKRIGHGCSKLRRKCLDWSNEVFAQGYELLIIVHDTDDDWTESSLKEHLNKLMKESHFTDRYLCVPVEELEAWFLSDPMGMKSTLHLDRLPKIKGNPETISSPKEYLGEEVRKCSNGRVQYVNTVHNSKLAQSLDLVQVGKKCSTFNSFRDFILSKKYQ